MRVMTYGQGEVGSVWIEQSFDFECVQGIALSLHGLPEPNMAKSYNGPRYEGRYSREVDEVSAAASVVLSQSSYPYESWKDIATHPKTSLELLLRVSKLNNPKRLLKTRAGIGTPLLSVLAKIDGAFFSRARKQSTRDEIYSEELAAEITVTTMMAFMTEAPALRQ